MSTNNIQTSDINHHRNDVPSPQHNKEAELKGCKRGCSVTIIDHLLLDKDGVENCKMRRTKLSIAWIDDKKALDSVPRSWMIKCMQIHKNNPKIIKLIGKAMELWNTTLILQHSEGNIEIPDVTVVIWQLSCRSSYHFLKHDCVADAVPLFQYTHWNWYSFRRPRKDDRLSQPLVY